MTTVNISGSGEVTSLQLALLSALDDAVAAMPYVRATNGKNCACDTARKLFDLAYPRLLGDLDSGRSVPVYFSSPPAPETVTRPQSILHTRSIVAQVRGAANWQVLRMTSHGYSAEDGRVHAPQDIVKFAILPKGDE